MKDETTLRDLRNTIYDRIKSDPDKQKRFKDLFGEDLDVHYLIDKILHQQPGILVVIDKFELSGEQEVLLDISNDLRIIPFVTFEQDGRMVHLVNPLHPIQNGGMTGIRDYMEQTTQPQTRGTGSYQKGVSCPKMGKKHNYEDKGTYWKCSVCYSTKSKR